MNVDAIRDNKSLHHAGTLPSRIVTSLCLLATLTLRFSPGMKLDAKKHAGLIGEKKLSSSDTQLLAVKPVLTSWSVGYGSERTLLHAFNTQSATRAKTNKSR
ncbi:hypothetical protein [Bradyrhizobium sp. NFR13]|uniref:hypothetical protein n=1 Tax=Bradyrhizobium sp. NFR13 TaxID=1566285 RepID=UPI00111407D1|nr:hypothetical protein [Bradyrhizobium sp. NFR13]